MKFSEALVHLEEGKFIARKYWSGFYIYLDMETGTIIYKKEGKRPSYYIPSQPDILAEDWKVV